MKVLQYQILISNLNLNETQDYEMPFTPEPGLSAKRRVCFPGRGGSGEWNRTATDGDSRTPQSAAHTHISHVTPRRRPRKTRRARGVAGWDRVTTEGLYCESKAGRPAGHVGAAG